MADGSKSLEQAMEEAKSIMRSRTFHFGKRPSVSSRAKTGRLFARSAPIRKGRPEARSVSPLCSEALRAKRLDVRPDDLLDLRKERL
jgi:hypothetical protein